jgi:Asp-tRNA(Asn)/Glu-tRNA(Gln) amidotransferase A subunit family amidase
VKSLDIWKLTAEKLSNLLTKGEVSALDVAKAHLDRYKTVEPKIHAFVHFDEEKVLSAAKALDEKKNSGMAKSRFWGIPVGIKDIYNTLDYPTEMGSNIWKGFTPGNDARVVDRFRKEDFLLLGKTKTSEFAVHEPTDTTNPHDIRRAPGTSSTGSAAAVAAGVVPIALGSQTGGSTIRPASYCGVVGYKPSFGLIPRTGVLKTTDTLDTIGWFTRSVKDAEDIFELTRVRGPNYPYVEENVVKRQKNKFRVAVLDLPDSLAGESYARDSLSRFSDSLSGNSSISLERFQIPEIEEIYEQHELIYSKALSYYFKGEKRNDREKISGVLLSMLDAGEKCSAEAYHQAIQRQAYLTRKYQKEISADVMITLGSSGDAPIGLNSPDRPDSCKIWTYLGCPALNLPIFKSPDEMPFGLQIISAKYNDYSVFAFAELIENWKKLEISPAEVKI